MALGGGGPVLDGIGPVSLWMLPEMAVLVVCHYGLARKTTLCDRTALQDVRHSFKALRNNCLQY